MQCPDLSPSPFEEKKRTILAELFSKKKEIVDLTISSPMQSGFAFDISEDLCYLAKNPSWQFSAPDACGQLYARTAIMEYNNKQSKSINSEDIFVTSSTSEAYSALFKVFCKKGDFILTPNPGYPLIDAIAELDNINTHPYFLTPNFEKNIWEIDLDSLELLPTNTKILLLIAPHNPTGHVPTEKEFEYIFEFCKKNNLALIIDNVFGAYIFGENSTFKITSATLSMYGVPTFILDGLSKTAGLPHIKVAWLKAFVPQKQKQHIYNFLEYILDSELNCSYLSQALCAKILPKAPEYQARIIELLKANQKILCNYFSNMGAKIILSAGGWYQSFYFPNANDEELCLSLLRDKQILTNPGFLFDFEEGFIVGSLITNQFNYKSHTSIVASSTNFLPL